MLTTRLLRLRRPGAVLLLWLAAALLLILARPAAAAGAVFSIYGDELVAEWEAIAFRAKVNAGAAAPTYAGARSLSVNYGQGE